MSDNEGGDYMPWSDEEEESYMRFIERREQEIYETLRAKIDAEGGDISMELEDAELAERRGEALTPEQQKLLIDVRRRR